MAQHHAMAAMARPWHMKAKPVLLLMTPRCLVGVTSVRKVTEAGPPTPMARPRQILSRLPWGQQLEPLDGDWEDSEDPEDVTNDVTLW